MDSANNRQWTDRHVLVVEDDPEINRLIGDYVEFAGFHYVAALDGRHALSEMNERIPCAVVLDLMLPDVSGWEVCRRIKGDRQTQDVPVIILTALDNDDARSEGMRSGASEYMTKPFDPDQLLALLKKYAGAAVLGVEE
ncbi:MAG TPA: response regulator [Tepidisphaeraceae bacterium]|jgi:DNA-binding response OmpR family regulator|nr:response regulator [Tepidisphaeraceae bacterium]